MRWVKDRKHRQDHEAAAPDGRSSDIHFSGTASRCGGRRLPREAPSRAKIYSPPIPECVIFAHERVRFVPIVGGKPQPAATAKRL
jgi:hypothetical protein